MSYYTNLSDPSAGPFFTQVSAINGSGVMVGVYADPGNVEHSFLYDGTAWTT